MPSKISVPQANRTAGGGLGRLLLGRLDELAHQRGPLADVDVLAAPALLGGVELQVEGQRGALGRVLAPSACRW